MEFIQALKKMKCLRNWN